MTSYAKVCPENPGLTRQRNNIAMTGNTDFTLLI
jgi:hypothetical protein